MIKQSILAAAIGAFAFFASDTAVHAEPVFIEVQAPPARIETYPHTVYLGQPAYYYEGHWYYRHGPRWGYYREEPRPLFQFRVGGGHHHWHHHHHGHRR